MAQTQWLMNDIVSFSEERDCDQFHSPVHLAKSIAIEAAELLERFQWSDEDSLNEVEEELADVLNYCFQLTAKLNLEPEEIVRKKMTVNAAKYPVEKSRGKSKIYDQL